MKDQKSLPLNTCTGSFEKAIRRIHIEFGLTLRKKIILELIKCSWFDLIRFKLSIFLKSKLNQMHEEQGCLVWLNCLKSLFLKILKNELFCKLYIFYIVKIYISF